jgi:hypothetical protein
MTEREIIIVLPRHTQSKDRKYIIARQTLRYLYTHATKMFLHCQANSASYDLLFLGTSQLPQPMYTQQHNTLKHIVEPLK